MQRELDRLELDEAHLKVGLVKLRKDAEDTLNLIPKLLADYMKKEGGSQIAPQVKVVEIVPNEELVNRDLYLELTKNTDEVNFIKILEKLGDINSQDKDGRTFLMHCILNGFHLGVKKLLDLGADVNICDNDGMNALLYYGQFPNIGNITKILESSTNVRAISPYSNNMNIAHLLVKNLAAVSWDAKDLIEDHTLYVSDCSMVLDGSQNYANIRISGRGLNSITLSGPSFTIGSISSCDADLVDTRQKHIFNLLKKLHSKDLGVLDRVDGSSHNIFSIALSGGYKDLALNLVKESIININYERGGIYNILADSAQFSTLIGSLDFFKEILKLTKKDCNIVSSKNHTLIDYGAATGDVKIVEFLVKEQNIDPNKFNPNGLLPFHNAASSGRLEVLEFLKPYMVDINVVTNNVQKYSALHYACLYGKSQAVLKLIEWGANIDLKDSSGLTPLIYAYDNGHIELAKKLIEIGADFNLEINGNRFITKACWRDDVEMVKFLVERKNVNPLQTNGLGVIPWHNAAALGSIKVLEFLKSYMEGKIDFLGINPKELGYSALHYACLYGKSEAVLKLIEWGANVDLKDASGWTALDWAIDNGYIDIVQILITNNADVNSKDPNNMHSLDWACIKGHKEIAELLISNGAEINLVSTKGLTPLIYAYDNGHIELAKKLIEIGADFNFEINGNRFITKACWRDDVEMVKFLVEQKNVNPLQTNALGVIPWHNAAALGSIKVLEFLKSYMEGKIDSLGINPKELGYSALHYACLYGKGEAVLKLIEWGADINLENGDGQTPLYLSLAQKDSNIIQALIDKGANIHIPMNDGDTVMQMVGYKGLIDFGKQFIEKGMSIDIQNHKGETASMLVCNSKQSLESKKKTLEFFIKNGSDIHLKNNEGKDLVDYIDIYLPKAKYLIDNIDSENVGLSDITQSEHFLQEQKIDSLGNIDEVDIAL
jgi:ankyrin repeat protein